LSGRRDTIRLVTRYSAETLEVGISIAVGAFIGVLPFNWIVNRFGQVAAYCFLFFWFFCGVIAGFRSLLRVVRRMQREEGRQDGNGNSP